MFLGRASIEIGNPIFHPTWRLTADFFCSNSLESRHPVEKFQGGLLGYFKHLLTGVFGEKKVVEK